MTVSNLSRADWRALTGAVLIGSGLGLGLGAAYLVAGMGRHAAEYAQAQEMALAAVEGYAPAAAPPQNLGGAMLSLVRPQASPAKLAVKAARARELECLTDAVYYEARGESPRGQFAVAQVVMNRVKHPAFPKTVCGVVFQGAGHRGCQFSFACDGSMRGRREASAWSKARRVAARALAGAAIAEVGHATHFHTTGVAPAWGPQMRRVAQVGTHIFYRFAPRKAVMPTLVEQAAVVLTAGPAPSEEITVTPALVEKVSDTLAQPLTETPAPAAQPAAPAPTPKPAEAAVLNTPLPVAEAAS